MCFIIIGLSVNSAIPVQVENPYNLCGLLQYRVKRYLAALLVKSIYKNSRFDVDRDQSKRQAQRVMQLAGEDCIAHETTRYIPSGWIVRLQRLSWLSRGIVTWRSLPDYWYC
jgi:hypothetical protein